MQESSRFMKKCLVVVMISTVSLMASLVASPVMACDCMEQSLEDAVRANDLVFRGTVTNLKRPSDPHGRVKVSVKVERAWKGQLSGEVTIFTPADSAMCAYEFASGHEYLIYATSAAKGGPEVSLCSRTKRTNIAGPDQAWLDRKYPARK
jgi:hypothetical protein